MGDALAGSVYKERTGKSSMVSDAEQFDEARAAGAKARLVEHSLGELEAIKEHLDGAVRETERSGPANRRHVKRRPVVAGMTSWHVDPASNSVDATVNKGQAEAAEDALAKYGDAVTIEESDLSLDHHLRLHGRR